MMLILLKIYHGMMISASAVESLAVPVLVIIILAGQQLSVVATQGLPIVGSVPLPTPLLQSLQVQEKNKKSFLVFIHWKSKKALVKQAKLQSQLQRQIF